MASVRFANFGPEGRAAKLPDMSYNGEPPHRVPVGRYLVYDEQTHWIGRYSPLYRKCSCGWASRLRDHYYEDELEYPEPELKPPDWVSRELTREMQRRAHEVEPDEPELEMVHSAVPAS